MNRWLHVITTDGDFQSRRGVQTLAGSDDAGLSSEIKTIGRGGTWRSVPFAAAGLHRESADLVHAWDMRSLAAAAIARVPRIVFTPPVFPTRGSAAWVRRIMEHGDVTLVSSSLIAHRAWLRHGIPSERCELIRPGVDLSRLRHRSAGSLFPSPGTPGEGQGGGRNGETPLHAGSQFEAVLPPPQPSPGVPGEGASKAASKADKAQPRSGGLQRARDRELRTALGFDDADHVLLAVGESTREARHNLSVWAASILHVLDPRQKLLLWGRGPLSGAAARLAMVIGQANLCAVMEEKLGRRVEFEELLSAVDMALITAGSPVASLPIAMCMAARVPIVATASPTVNEMLRHEKSAWIAETAAPRRIAQAIGDLRASLQLQSALTEGAARAAREIYSSAEFITAHRVLYSRLLADSSTPPVARASCPC